MKLTRADIITLFRSSYAEPQNTFIDDDDVMIWWWSALSQFFARVDCEWTRSEATTHSIAGTPEYPLPADVRNIIAAYCYDGSQWNRLMPLDYQRFLQMPQTAAAAPGNATHYYQYRNQIGIYPKPSSSSLSSLLTGGWTGYSEVAGNAVYIDNTHSIHMGLANQYAGMFVDITALNQDTVQTFGIISHTQNAITCLPINTSTGSLGTVAEIPTVLKDPTSYALTFQIWEYVENIKVVYAERPPIPNEDSARGMGSVSDSEAANIFTYYVPEEYLDTLQSYLLYRASVKDKLLRDAGFHKSEWEMGILNAIRNANHSVDDAYAERRSRGSFSPRVTPASCASPWWRVNHNVT